MPYEKTPGGGLKPSRVRVGDDRGIGCQMCFSDDLTETHRHRERGEMCREHAGRYYDGSKNPMEENNPLKPFQLELTGSEPDPRPDKKVRPWDALKIYELDEGAEPSQNFYEPTEIDAVNGLYVMDAEEKLRLEKSNSTWAMNKRGISEPWRMSLGHSGILIETEDCEREDKS